MATPVVRGVDAPDRNGQHAQRNEPQEGIATVVGVDVNEATCASSDVIWIAPDLVEQEDHEENKQRNNLENTSDEKSFHTNTTISELTRSNSSSVNVDEGVSLASDMVWLVHGVEVHCEEQRNEDKNSFPTHANVSSGVDQVVFATPEPDGQWRKYSTSSTCGDYKSMKTNETVSTSESSSVHDVILERIKGWDNEGPRVQAGEGETYHEGESQKPSGYLNSSQASKSLDERERSAIESIIEEMRRLEHENFRTHEEQAGHQQQEGAYKEDEERQQPASDAISENHWWEFSEEVYDRKCQYAPETQQCRREMGANEARYISNYRNFVVSKIEDFRRTNPQLDYRRMEADEKEKERQRVLKLLSRLLVVDNNNNEFPRSLARQTSDGDSGCQMDSSPSSDTTDKSSDHSNRSCCMEEKCLIGTTSGCTERQSPGAMPAPQRSLIDDMDDSDEGDSDDWDDFVALLVPDRKNENHASVRRPLVSNDDEDKGERSAHSHLYSNHLLEPSLAVLGPDIVHRTRDMSFESTSKAQTSPDHPHTTAHKNPGDKEHAARDKGTGAFGDNKGHSFLLNQTESRSTYLGKYIQPNSSGTDETLSRSDSPTPLYHASLSSDDKMLASGSSDLALGITLSSDDLDYYSNGEQRNDVQVIWQRNL